MPASSHPITIEPNPSRVTVRVGGQEIASTTRALSLKEASYPAVVYVPREDADMSLLQRTERSTHCPYKGDASYFTIEAGGRTLSNAVWSYEQPLAAVAAIKDHLAFYTDRVELVQQPRG